MLPRIRAYIVDPSFTLLTAVVRKLEWTGKMSNWRTGNDEVMILFVLIVENSAQIAPSDSKSSKRPSIHPRGDT